MGQVRDIADLFRSAGELRQFSAGQHLQSADYRRSVMMIESGMVASRPASSSPRTRRRYIHLPEELLNLDILQSTIRHRMDTVFEALSDTVVYVLPVAKLRLELEHNNKLAMSLMEHIIGQNAYYKMRIENLSYIYASDRLTYRILYLAERFGVVNGSHIVIKVPMNHSQIGSFINLTRESVSREMEKLVAKGLITYDKEFVTILNPAALADSFYQSVRADWSGVVGMVAKPKSRRTSGR